MKRLGLAELKQLWWPKMLPWGSLQNYWSIVTEYALVLVNMVTDRLYAAAAAAKLEMKYVDSQSHSVFHYGPHSAALTGSANALATLPALFALELARSAAWTGDERLVAAYLVVIADSAADKC